MRVNATKAKLGLGEAVFGCWLRYGDPGLVEFIGYQGWDFVVVDGEHGTIDPRECENVVRAAELRDVTPIVRVTTNEMSLILRFMDTGAQGAQIPMINTAEQAEAAVAAIKYWPRGARGLAASRSASYAQASPLAEYVIDANRETLVIAQVETLEAVENLPSIVEVDGIDVIFIGATDLSSSLGVPGQTSHQSVEQAINSIIATVTKSSCALGVMVSTTAAAQEWRERGARYIAFTLEGMIRDSARTTLTAMRAGHGPPE